MADFIQIEVLSEGLIDFDAVKREIFEEYAPKIEKAGQTVLSESPPSVRGGHPAKRTGTGLESLEVKPVGDILELSVIYYMGFHDEVFEGQVKSAGWTERPFVQDILDLALINQ